MNRRGHTDGTRHERALPLVWEPTHSTRDQFSRRTVPVLVPRPVFLRMRVGGRARVKPYYDDGTCVIYHGRCEDVLPSLECVDVVVTSPPYNLGDMSGGLANLAGGYDEHADALDPDEYDQWQRDVLRELWRLTAPGGAIFYNHKPVVRDRVASLPTRLVPDGCVLRQIIVWDRGIGSNWSPSHFLPVHEWLLLIAHDAFRLRDKSASHASDVWRFPPVLSQEEHPAPFPLGLPARAIEASAPRVVLDPFMGSGTTLRAAKNANVAAIGIDVSERYCEIAAKRLAQEVLDFGGAA